MPLGLANLARTTANNACRRLLWKQYAFSTVKERYPTLEVQAEQTRMGSYTRNRSPTARVILVLGVAAAL